MSQGRAPWWANSTIFWRVESGSGRPLTYTPPNWLTPEWPGNEKNGQRQKQMVRLMVRMRVKILANGADVSCGLIINKVIKIIVTVIGWKGMWITVGMVMITLMRHPVYVFKTKMTWQCCCRCRGGWPVSTRMTTTKARTGKFEWGRRDYNDKMIPAPPLLHPQERMNVVEYNTTIIWLTCELNWIEIRNVSISFENHIIVRGQKKWWNWKWLERGNIQWRSSQKWFKR